MISSGRDTSNKASSPKFTFQYGYAEIRAKVPRGRGLWPAFWMLPETQKSLPEIDVMEILGHQPSRVHMNYHYLGPGRRPAQDSGDWIGPDFSMDWHTFAMGWQEDAIIWYVDGSERRRYTAAKRIAKEPMYLVANLAVGGDWPGRPISDTGFPSDFEIDYVRVWGRED